MGKGKVRIVIEPAEQRSCTDEWLSKFGFKTGDVVDAEFDPRQDEIDDKNGRPTPRARSFMGAVRFKAKTCDEYVTLFRQEWRSAP